MDDPCRTHGSRAVFGAPVIAARCAPHTLGGRTLSGSASRGLGRNADKGMPSDRDTTTVDAAGRGLQGRAAKFAERGKAALHRMIGVA